MLPNLPRPLLRLEYEKAAEAYLRSLPLEHFMEATPQATQREITVESLALVKTQRSDFHYFNELLVQYPFGRQQEIHQVVPDNMVVQSTKPLKVQGSYDVPFQPVGPLWTLEYVSQSSERKDYQDSFHKYERELKVPYYLVFYPEAQELTLFHLKGRKYVAVPPNATGRCALPELDMEMAIWERWTRFWYRGDLLPLPADLQRDLDERGVNLRRTKAQLRRSRQEVEQARAQAEQERQAKERLLAQLRALGIEPE